MKNWLLVLSLFCAGLTRCDDCVNLIYALKNLAGEEIVSRPESGEKQKVSDITPQPTGPHKLLIIADRSVQNDELNIFIENLYAENRKHDNNLFSGDVEVNKNRLDDIGYKIIFLFKQRPREKTIIFRHDGYFGFIEHRVPLLPKRACVVMYYDPDAKISATLGELTNYLRMNLPKDYGKMAIVGCVWKKIIHKLLWVIPTAPSYEFSEIYWPGSLEQWAKEGMHPGVNLKELYSENVKTIYDWLLWN